jgi:hypothetical protein
VALFHLFALCYTFWNVHSVPFPSLEWLQMAWVSALFICWLLICDLNKWAGITYILLTALNISLYLGLKSYDDKVIYTNAFFPVDIVFSFFVLLFYKKLS